MEQDKNLKILFFGDVVGRPGRTVLQKFLNDNPLFSIDESIEIYNGNYGEYTFLPHIDGTDGFYVAVLNKN